MKLPISFEEVSYFNNEYRGDLIVTKGVLYYFPHTRVVHARYADELGGKDAMPLFDLLGNLAPVFGAVPWIRASADKSVKLGKFLKRTFRPTTNSQRLQKNHLWRGNETNENLQKVFDEYIEKVKREMPELPDAMRDRFMADYEISFSDASQLVSDINLANFFERTAALSGNPRTTANWIRGEFMRELEKADKSILVSTVWIENLAELIKILDAGKINNNQAKEILTEMFASGNSAATIIAEKGFEQVSDTGEIEKIVDEVIANNQNQVKAYQSGNEKLFGFFVGQTMKGSQGKANPRVVNEILKQKLSE
jgi:Glu-tRNA(Gln) amidotransferase subunit E-like FAD-binding protein